MRSQSAAVPHCDVLCCAVGTALAVLAVAAVVAAAAAAAAAVAWCRCGGLWPLPASLSSSSWWPCEPRMPGLLCGKCRWAGGRGLAHSPGQHGATPTAPQGGSGAGVTVGQGQESSGARLSLVSHGQLHRQVGGRGPAGRYKTPQPLRGHFPDERWGQERPRGMRNYP